MPFVRYNGEAVSPKVDFLEGNGYHVIDPGYAKAYSGSLLGFWA